jgi:peptidoglycan/xylan/chitin deacetylase (PgdA/CDA1 family)
MSVPSAIITYHSLDTSGSVISIQPELFRRHIEGLLEQRVPIVPLDQAVRTPGSVALTFDDGFKNLVEQAFPLLERYRLPATVFMVTGYCGRLNTWPGQPELGIQPLPLMNHHDLQQLPNGVELGAHTATHPNLTKLPPEQASMELRTSRMVLEDITGRQVRWLAYPYGASTPKVRELARQEFVLACGTELKYVKNEADPLNLPRIDAYYLRLGLRAERLLAPIGTAYIALRNVLRATRARVTA